MNNYDFNKVFLEKLLAQIDVDSLVEKTLPSFQKAIEDDLVRAVKEDIYILEDVTAILNSPRSKAGKLYKENCEKLAERMAQSLVENK